MESIIYVQSLLAEAVYKAKTNFELRWRENFFAIKLNISGAETF
jgi:hypothetical protein